MAINDSDLSVVLQNTNAVSTTEANFREGLEDTIRQVDTTQQHMDADRSITLTGDVTGSVTGLNWNESGDYDISIALTYANNIDNDNIATNSINADRLVNNSITNTQIASGTISEDRIEDASKNRLTILDTNGSTILFQGDTLTV